MNITSTVTVLSLAPSDVNDLLSVVFIGSRKFKPEHLGNMYRIRKSKVWRFLQWLVEHNRLYAKISLDELTMDLYPEDGYLPVKDRVIHDRESNVEDIFIEETAGISKHPAELLGSSSETSESEPFNVMLEKMGVADPECDRMPGRLFTAAALRNLIPDGSELPDLILHRGSAAVPEYNNSDLIPGMYPTLFPVGVGGFETTGRPCAISFQKQAEYYLDPADRSFRYHSNNFLGYFIYSPMSRYIAQLLSMFVESFHRRVKSRRSPNKGKIGLQGVGDWRPGAVTI